MDTHEALDRYFGFPRFRAGQAEALERVLAGRDLLVVMPTGAGKSLIYQLAGLLLPHMSLVVSPLVALMKDQVDGLARRQIAATYINSSLDSAEQARRLRAMDDGAYKIVLVAPERLRSRAFLTSMERLPVSQLVVDEAHCLSQWGHDFRPDYLHIAEARQRMRAPVTLALTATATPRVQADITRLLGIPDAERLVLGFNRPNLSLEVVSTPSEEAKYRVLRDLLADASGAGIVYTGTRAQAEEVAEFARTVAGVEARTYHAGLDQALRAQVQDAFMAGDLPLVVATNAFGMGIDRPDVRFVAHFNMPGTLEQYYQEAGRAGRDGLPARAVLLHSTKDAALHEFFIESNSPTADTLRAVHAFLAARGQRTGVRLEQIEQTLSLRQIQLRVALDQLEAADALARLPDPYFGWLDAEVRSLSEARLQAVAAQVQTRRAHLRHLLGLMEAYAESDACRRRTLLDYFGDLGPADAPICCDNCLARARPAEADTPARPAQTQAERGALIVLDTIAHLVWSIGATKLAQVLKGSSAQEVQAYRNAHNFGKLALLRIGEIEALINQLVDAGYIKQVGGKYPTLRLAGRGSEALQARAAIAVDVRPAKSDALRRRIAVREAGGTIALTEQLQRQGKTPEQIAAERGLTTMTIYSHLAQLIAAGRVDARAVVPDAVRAQIERAIEQIGSAEQIVSIKQLLPDDVEFGVIRCVVEGWKRARGIESQYGVAQKTTAPSQPAPEAAAGLIEKLRAWRLSRSRQDKVPAFMVFSDETLANIAALLPTSHEALSAIRGIGPTKLDLYGAEVLEIVAQDSQSDTLARNTDASVDTVSDFLARPHPRPLPGPWLAGWALDAHSHFDGAANRRSSTGDLVYRYKYDGERALANELARRWHDLLTAHPELPPFDAIVSVPSSTRRAFDPVPALAAALAARLGVPAWNDTLLKARATRPQKELNSLTQKTANVRGAFAIARDVGGKRLLLVDDLYDSGATLAEAARLLRNRGAASVVVLTLTKTIHTDA